MHSFSPSYYLLPHMSKYYGLHIVFSIIGLCFFFHVRDKKRVNVYIVVIRPLDSVLNLVLASIP